MEQLWHVLGIDMLSYLQRTVLRLVVWCIQVLEDLLKEDDSDPNVWYLMALCYHAGGHYLEALDAIAKGEGALQVTSGSKLATEEPAFGELRVRSIACTWAFDKRLQEP